MWEVTEHARDGRRSMSLDEFRRRLPAICRSHRAQGRALAFGLILSDVRHPHLQKALEDDAYWRALDESTGRALTVFSFEFAPRQQPTMSTPPDRMECMVAVTGASRERVHDILQEHFPGLTVQRLPAVLFFQVDGNGRILDSCAAALTSNPVDPAQAYNSLQGVLEVAVRSVEHVDDAYAENAREVYQLIVEGLHDLAVKRRIRSVYKGIKAAAGVASIARLVSGLA